MSFNLAQIEKQAEKIRQMLKSGELIDGCCMSAAQTPVREAWEIAQELTENETLSDVQKHKLFSKLDREIQSQLETAGYYDFDLVFERLLQPSSLKKKPE